MVRDKEDQLNEPRILRPSRSTAFFLVFSCSDSSAQSSRVSRSLLFWLEEKCLLSAFGISLGPPLNVDDPGGSDVGCRGVMRRLDGLELWMLEGNESVLVRGEDRRWVEANDRLGEIDLFRRGVEPIRLPASLLLGVVARLS